MAQLNQLSHGESIPGQATVGDRAHQAGYHYSAVGENIASGQTTVEQVMQNFLTGKCNFKTGRCNRLHLCHHFDYYNTKECRFPRDFSYDYEYNRRIIEQSNCSIVNPILLLRLIQLNEKLSHDLSQ
ncbi:unnamed protein product, partial [Rotaria sp. Silwood2]